MDPTAPEYFGRCALPEQLVLDAALARWSKLKASLCVLGSLPGVSDQEHQAVLDTVCLLWNPHSRFKLFVTQDARTSDIRQNSGVIDGRGGTLAWSELPNGSDQVLRQMYDSSERWTAVLQRSQVPQGMIPLVVTMAHEVGHALGLGHSNDPSSLMYPSLNVNAWGPQAWDIRELVARYGPPDATPPPPTDDDRVTVIPSKHEVVVPSAAWTLRVRSAQ